MRGIDFALLRKRRTARLSLVGKVAKQIGYYRTFNLRLFYGRVWHVRINSTAILYYKKFPPYGGNRSVIYPICLAERRGFEPLKRF